MTLCFPVTRISGKRRKGCLTSWTRSSISRWMLPPVMKTTSVRGISRKTMMVCGKIGGGETVFCNPPYGSKETGLWTEKCYREGQKPGTTVVLLIPARTDRASFHDYILGKAEIRFLRGRLKFELDGKPMGTAPFPSMIAIWRGGMT